MTPEAFLSSDEYKSWNPASKFGFCARIAGMFLHENPAGAQGIGREQWEWGWRQADQMAAKQGHGARGKEPQDAFSYADKESDSTDHHQHSWNLAEALSEIVRGEVEKQVESAVQAWGMDQIEHPDPLTHEWVVQQIRSELENWSSSTADAIESLKEKAEHLFICQHKAEQRILELESVDRHTGEILARELGPSWMDRIEALELRISEAEHTQDQDRDELGRQIQGLRELVDMQIERAATRIANLQQDLMDTNTHLATANERIADLETTLGRLEGLDAEDGEPDSYVTTHDCDELRWPDGLDAEYLNQVPKEVREAAADIAMQILDDNAKDASGEPEVSVPCEGDSYVTPDDARRYVERDEDARTTTPHEFASAVAKLGDLVFGMKDQSEDDEQDSEDECIRQAYEEIKRAILGAKDTLDEHVTWYSGKPPAAGPWREGFPPTSGAWLVAGPEMGAQRGFFHHDSVGEYVRVGPTKVRPENNLISHHARIHLPETTDD